VRTIAIYLGGTPTDGGTYQNALSLVSALSTLPNDSYRVIGYCADAAWEDILADHGVTAALFALPLGVEIELPQDTITRFAALED